MSQPCPIDDSVVEPNVVFELPVPPDFMAELAKSVVHPADAQPGDLVGMGASILRMGSNIVPEDVRFLRAQERGEAPEEVLPEDLADHPQLRQIFLLLAQFLRTGLDNILVGDHFALDESSAEEGYHYLGLSLFPGAVIVADTVHDPGYLHPDDLALTNALYLGRAHSAHDALAQQRRVDAIVDIFADLSITGDLAGQYRYARVHLPQDS